jgi:hypothetical protein
MKYKILFNQCGLQPAWQINFLKLAFCIQVILVDFQSDHRSNVLTKTPSPA